MSPILLGLLKMMIPAMEKMGLEEWETLGLPAVKGIAMNLKAGNGQEEMLILADALDKIVKFEATRKFD